MHPVTVAILRSNPIAPDPRVEKTARALARANCSVTVVGWDRTGTLPQVEERGPVRVERIPLRAQFGAGLRNLPHLLRWQVRLWQWLFLHRREYQVIHACDFDTVLPALIAKWLFRKKVVYDVFDFYADMLRRTPAVLRWVIRKMDLWVMGKVDAVILADEVRREQIRGASPRRLEVIYNSPEAWRPPSTRAREDKTFRIAYVGLLQIERGLLYMLEVLKHHPEWKLDLAGFGGDEKEILDMARTLPNVRIHGRVPYEKALQISANADVLFATYDPAIRNHRYSSANKLFEAMMLGKPIIVAERTGMDRLVNEYNLGFVVEYGNLAQLEGALAQVASWDPETKHAFSERVRSVYMQRFSWDLMAERLVQLYAELNR